MLPSPESRPASVMPTSFGSASLVVLAAGQLAGDRHLEPMLSGADVTGVDPLHAPLLQSFELFEAVDVMRSELAVDLDAHRVEPES
jgi:hypothetical protein